MLKDDASERARGWVNGMHAIGTHLATRYGKDTPLYKLMGSLAWGRHEHEQGPRPWHKDTDLMAIGYCEGVRAACMKAGQLFGYPGTVLFEELPSQIRASELARARMNASGE